MSKFFKIITGVLILNIIALSAALIFITVKKLTPKAQNNQEVVIKAPEVNSPNANYKIPQWKLIGALDNSDLVYDFKNGLGGELNSGPEGQLLDGESVWIYSKKLREILTEINKSEKKYSTDDEYSLGYIAIINRVSKTKIDTPSLWKIFPTAIGDHRFNIVKPSKVDLMQNDEANKIFYESRKEIDAFFASLETDKTAPKN